MCCTIEDSEGLPDCAANQHHTHGSGGQADPAPSRTPVPGGFVSAVGSGAVRRGLLHVVLVPITLRCRTAQGSAPARGRTRPRSHDGRWRIVQRQALHLRDRRGLDGSSVKPRVRVEIRGTPTSCSAATRIVESMPPLMRIELGVNLGCARRTSPHFSCAAGTILGFGSTGSKWFSTYLGTVREQHAETIHVQTERGEVVGAGVAAQPGGAARAGQERSRLPCFARPRPPQDCAPAPAAASRDAAAARSQKTKQVFLSSMLDIGPAPL